MLRVGSKGDEVVEWQRLLKAAGFFRAGVAPIFGPRTHAATVAFQRSRNLDADGIVGPKTWAAMSAPAAESLPIEVIAERAGIPVPVLKAIQKVESNGKPAAVRFEPHLFLRKRPDLSDLVPYTRSSRGYSLEREETGRRALESAMKLDAEIAIRSTSFGCYQVLGGYLLEAYPGDPVAAYHRFREDPVEASDLMVAAWFRDNARARSAANQNPPDFLALARAYNGPNQHVHSYDERLEKAWRRYK